MTRPMSELPFVPGLLPRRKTKETPMLTFDSKPELVGVLAQRTAREIEDEPMLYRASIGFAAEVGGPVTVEFINTLAKSGLLAGDTNVVIDTRSHMLMRGTYPCVGGWHHDDVPRNTANGQPNHDPATRPYRSQHLMCVIDAIDQPSGSLPEFALGPVSVPWPLPDDAIVYAAWDAHMNASGVQSMRVSSRQVWRFDCDAFHRGMPATSFGWRIFLRASWSTHVKPENKVRRNANVYVPAGGMSW